MLKSINRLKKRKEFGYIYKHGESVYTKNLVLMHTFNKFKKTSSKSNLFVKNGQVT